MFNSLTGSFTVYDSTSITPTTMPDVAIDELKDWTITIGTTSYLITSNDETKIYFANALVALGNYTIDFCARADLVRIEDSFSSTVKFPDALINGKIAITKLHFIQKVQAYFKNLYTLYSDLDDPMSLIINLGQLKLTFIYYCIAECYSDVTLTKTDINIYNEEKYRAKYKDTFKDSMGMLCVDSDEAGELSNDDKGASASKGVLLSR